MLRIMCNVVCCINLVTICYVTLVSLVVCLARLDSSRKTDSRIVLMGESDTELLCRLLRQLADSCYIVSCDVDSV